MKNHEPIIDDATWYDVQAKIKYVENARSQLAIVEKKLESLEEKCIDNTLSKDTYASWQADLSLERSKVIRGGRGNLIRIRQSWLIFSGNI